MAEPIRQTALLTSIHGSGLASGPSIGACAAAMAVPTAETFRAGLQELGYPDGQNLVMNWRFAEGRDERLPDLMAELLRLPLDLLLTAGLVHHQDTPRFRPHATDRDVQTGQPDRPHHR
jgi:hypothetical protein